MSLSTIEFRVPEQNAQLLDIYIDKEFWRCVWRSLFRKQLNSFISHSKGVEDFKTKFHELEYQIAKSYALNLLGMRSYATAKLQRKLEEKLFSIKITEQVLLFCQEHQYLNDQAYADRFVQKLQARGYGPKYIRVQLRMQGLEIDGKHSLSHQMHDAEAQQQAIARLVQKYQKKYDLTDFKQKQKLVAALLRKGFDFEHISRGVKIPSP